MKLISPSASDKPGIWRNYFCDVIENCRETNATGSMQFTDAVAGLGDVLAEAGDDDGSITLQEQWAIFHEARQEWPTAADRREREVAYLFNLFAMGGAIRGVLTNIDCHYLISRLQLLLRDLQHTQRSQRAGYVAGILSSLQDPDTQTGINAGIQVPKWQVP